MEQLLRLIEADCTLSHKQLAAMVGTSEEKVDAEVKRLEDDGRVSFHHHEVVGAKMTRARLRALLADLRASGVTLVQVTHSMEDAARADREAFADFYDAARYSAHEVDAARADQFKKDLKL